MDTDEIEKELRRLAAIAANDLCPDESALLSAAADIVHEHEGLEVYKTQHCKAIDACLWMHDDKTLDIPIGSSITSTGVLALKKQRDYLMFENDALCAFINREMKMTATDPRIVELKEILEKGEKEL